MVQNIAMPEFEELLRKNRHVDILDVRETYEYDYGHIPNAVSVPLSAFPIELDKGRQYYIVCQTGARSAMACQHLAQKGYDVINVMGGMSSWRGELK